MRTLLAKCPFLIRLPHPLVFSLLLFFHRRQRITKKHTSYQRPASGPKPACAAAAASLAAGSLVHSPGWRSRSAIGKGSTFWVCWSRRWRGRAFVNSEAGVWCDEEAIACGAGCFAICLIDLKRVFGYFLVAKESCLCWSMLVGRRGGLLKRIEG